MAAEKERVCKNCGFLTTEKICIKCSGKQFLDKYKGSTVILNAKESEVAAKLGISENGKFAMKYD